MNEPVDAEETWKLKVAAMEGELNAIRTTNVAIYDETLKSTKIFQIFALLLAIATGLFSIWSTERVDKTISNAEQRIASLSGGFIPLGARVQSLAGDNRLPVELYIQKGEAFGINGYRVIGQAAAEIVIEGDVPGKMLGFQASISGKFVDEMLMRSHSDEPSRREFTRLKFISATNSAEGLTLPPETPYRLTYIFGTFFKTCENAKQFIDNAKKSDWSLMIQLRPVLIDSKRTAKSTEFEAALFDRGAKYNCQEKSGNNEKPSS